MGMTLWILSIFDIRSFFGRFAWDGSFGDPRSLSISTSSDFILGSFLTLGGLFLACGSTICLVYVFVVVVPLNVFRARVEEVVFARTTW